ncbi:hypothetical protein [Burkholderia cepacia]|uniref:hypothetical protein n=1 Tax=Burkholderia cepacia TaxID=292 RepID=UPI001FC83E99|nr:hypothetical protein [Burkholderia cepacia]
MQSLPAERTRHWLTKVPDVALSLRIVKIMSTTVGETGADYLAVNVGLGRIVTRIAMASRLAIALWMQLRTHCEVSWICQPTVVLVNIVGTRIADLLIVEVNVSLHASATINAARSRRSSSCGIALNARCRSTRSSRRNASGSMSGRYGSATSAVQRTPRLNVSRRSSRDRSCATG